MDIVRQQQLLPRYRRRLASKTKRKVRLAQILPVATCIAGLVALAVFLPSLTGVPTSVLLVFLPDLSLLVAVSLVLWLVSAIAKSAIAVNLHRSQSSFS